jgi:hypothetical protein
MNARIARILRIDSFCAKHLDRNLILEIDQLVAKHDTLGLIPSTQLLLKTLSCESTHPIHCKLINTFLPQIVQSVHLLPNSLAVKTFHQLTQSELREARTVLCALQDKWCDNWRASAVAESSKRLEFKDTPLSGPYLHGVGRSDSNTHSPIVNSLDNNSVVLGIQGIEKLCTSAEEEALADLSVIIHAFLNEASSRDVDAINSALEQALCIQLFRDSG